MAGHLPTQAAGPVGDARALPERVHRIVELESKDSTSSVKDVLAEYRGTRAFGQLREEALKFQGDPPARPIALEHTGRDVNGRWLRYWWGSVVECPPFKQAPPRPKEPPAAKKKGRGAPPARGVAVEDRNTLGS